MLGAWCVTLYNVTTQSSAQRHGPEFSQQPVREPTTSHVGKDRSTLHRRAAGCNEPEHKTFIDMVSDGTWQRTLKDLVRLGSIYNDYLKRLLKYPNSPYSTSARGWISFIHCIQNNTPQQTEQKQTRAPRGVLLSGRGRDLREHETIPLLWLMTSCFQKLFFSKNVLILIWLLFLVTLIIVNILNILPVLISNVADISRYHPHQRTPVGVLNSF